MKNDLEVLAEKHAHNLWLRQSQCNFSLPGIPGCGPSPPFSGTRAEHPQSKAVKARGIVDMLIILSKATRNNVKA